MLNQNRGNQHVRYDWIIDAMNNGMKNLLKKSEKSEEKNVKYVKYYISN